MSHLDERDSVADRVIARAQNRRRPLMPNDESIIRVLADNFVETLTTRGEYPTTPEEEANLVEYLVAIVGNLEFELGKTGGFKLALRKPDGSLYPDEAA